MLSSSRRALSLTIVLAILLSVFPLAASAQDAQVDFWLTVLHNNDAESQLINLGPGLEDFGGVARFKTLVDILKFEATRGRPPEEQRGAKRGVIMVSSGDNFLAGPEFNVSLEKGIPFYDTIAMDIIGYDAVAIGNHDFDFGPDVLADFIIGYQKTHPPYLSANLDYSGEPRLQELFEQGRIARSTVVRERGELIGIIGATTPALSFISSPRNVEVIDDVAGAVQTEVEQLEAMGVGIIILISHLQSIEEDLALAPQLDGVDIMVAGGGDELLANEDDLLVPSEFDEEGNPVFPEPFGPYPMFAMDMDGTQVPVVTTQGSYSYVGKLVAGFDDDGNLLEISEESGPVRVVGGNYPDAVRPHRGMLLRVVEPVLAAIAALAENIIGTSEVDLNGLRIAVRSQETNEGNLIADSLFWQADQLAASFGVGAPDVALQNGGGIRNDSVIPAGPISELDTFDMLPFPNFVTIVESIPPEQFKEIMENAVSRVEFGDGRFAQISGFTFVWDPAGTPQELDEEGNVVTPGTRVVEITLNDGTAIVSGGAVVPGAPSVNIATIDFLARGGDQYPFRGAPFTSVGVSYQQALENYIIEGLGGLISAADYPEGGEGRITQAP